MGKMKMPQWLQPHLRRIGRVPILGRGLLIVFRMMSGAKTAMRPTGRLLVWSVRSREYTNYTYHLTDLNQDHLACFVAEIAGIPVDQARRYMNEIESDAELKAHIRGLTTQSEDGRFADSEVRFGRRSGWYAFVRAVKPRVVVETGVDKGLGSCVLTAALSRNSQDGHPGYYYGTDKNPRAGYLLQGQYAELGRVLYGDSVESLEKLSEQIDLFINDSDHSAAYEAREYAAVKGKLGEHALIVGDNAHVTDELLKFATQTGRSFLYFAEEPRDHWYPGGGIGVAFRTKRDR